MMLKYEQEAIEKMIIAQQVAAWGILRDAGRWGPLRDIWTEDGTIEVTWFKGTADEFIDASKELTDNPNRRPFNQHLFCGAVIDVNGDHAVSEARGEVIIRLPCHGVMCDLTSLVRFYDFFVKTPAGWKMKKRVGIFDKDMIAPMNYGEELKIDIERLNSFPPAYRHIAYCLSQMGIEMNMHLPAPNSPAQDALYAEGAAWLAAGSKNGA